MDLTKTEHWKLSHTLYYLFVHKFIK